VTHTHTHPHSSHYQAQQQQQAQPPNATGADAGAAAPPPPRPVSVSLVEPSSVLQFVPTRVVVQLNSSALCRGLIEVRFFFGGVRVRSAAARVLRARLACWRQALVTATRTL
jgi:hypothetical protein